MSDPAVPRRPPPLRYDPSARRMTRCQANDDGYCDYVACPQRRDCEPENSGRHCPLDAARICDEADRELRAAPGGGVR
jgi:hypothetical protein